MEQLKMLKELMIAKVQGEFGHLEQVDAKELGEAVDIIKDLAETMKLCEEEKYYKTITDAMEEKHDEPRRYYPGPENWEYPHYPYDRYDEFRDGRMYYSSGSNNGGRSGNNGSSSSSTRSSGGNNARGGGTRGYEEYEYPFPPMNFRDQREGRAPMARRMYMESKEMHKDQNAKMQDLEHYMQGLGSDITEMIMGASPEEKQVLVRKMQELQTKINNA